jgi:putative acetyltransferase
MLQAATMKAVLSIRPERFEDLPQIHRVLAAAFPTAAEADLVDRLRDAVSTRIALVAELGGLVVGYILFSPVTLRDGACQEEAVGLAPMAVQPEYQRQGIGSSLVVAGLGACVDRGDSMVFVVGHPEFYPRFGFEPAAPRGFHYIDEGFDPYLFVAELEEGALQGKHGWVEYHPEFDKLENEEDGP